MTIEDFEAVLSMAVACGLVLRCWRIPMSALHDIIRRAPGGAALILDGDGVKIAGLPVEVVQVGGPREVILVSAIGEELRLNWPC
ncbi:hypothetical protein [Sphingomonas montanisoli]|uniref:Uncharacterized protein n=1 Tax=Sphingomonas montanisoli TaxID=2606412 RepID=A0A5D9C7A8_9SPHN|nr:hypothetical protein [Sphingomonas montanisoli]TZG25871.1 hypothetical protein FYJ91_12890 [Sphingomonas montanisoli]